MPVLGTKLHPPAPRRRLVQRDRLVNRLAAGAGETPRLVLIAAPAGFGKTTLLTQWLAAEQGRRTVAWLALDAADADLRRFLTHLVTAVRTIEPDVGADALALLGAGDSTPAEAVLVSLVNDLDVLAGSMVIALDDYHVIDGTPVHEVVAFLVDNLPPHLTLAMTTRADPPLPLSRLRARGELVEVRAADLRFTDEEAEAFLNGVMGLALGPDLVADLEARTEGWAVGLQLAALAARSHSGSGGGAGAGSGEGSEDVAAFVDAFSGSHRFVLDYLVEEVLDRQQDEVRDFLLDTSVLEELSAGLCDALTGRTDGQRMLETLDRENLFVVPLDSERQWYRYHHLFADALRARLTARQAAHPTFGGTDSPTDRPTERPTAQPNGIPTAQPNGIPTGPSDGIPTRSATCMPRRAGGSPSTDSSPTRCRTRSRVASPSMPPTSSSSRWRPCASNASTALSGSGSARCPMTSSAAGRCSPR